EDAAGLALPDDDTGFIEVGLDSLMLTQIAQQLEKAFGVKVTFRQLMRECSNLALLAAMLAPHVQEPAGGPAADATPPSGPAGAGPVHPAAAPPTAGPAGAAAAGTETAALLERQLQLMAQQLALAAKLDGLDAETLRGLLASQHALMAAQLALASGRAAAAGATTVQWMAADEPRAPDTPAPAAAAPDGVPAARAVMDPT